MKLYHHRYKELEVNLELIYLLDKLEMPIHHVLYIYDDRASFEDITERITEVYNLSNEERKSKGLKGREWCLSEEAGFYAEKQGERVIEAFEELFKIWKPREDFELIDVNEVKGKFLNHKIIY